MLISIAKSPPSFCFSPAYENFRANSLNSCRSYTFFKPSSRIITSVAPKTSICCTTSLVSSSPAITVEANAVDYNSQIYELCQLGNLREAMKLLCLSQSYELDTRTYCSILELCAKCNSLQNGKKVYSVIRSNEVVIDSVLGSKLVFMFVTCGDIKSGRRVFDEICSERVFLWNLLINGYAKIGDFGEGFCLFKQMLELGIEVNPHTFSSVLKCLAGIRDAEGGEQVHGYLLRLDFGSWNVVANSLISFYFKIRRVESAHKVFGKLTDRDVISWNSMISGYVTNGLAVKGLEVFRDMVCLGIDTDLATTVNVLVACADCGALTTGKSVHASTLKTSSAEKVMLNNALVDMYSKCGDLDSSIRVFEKMGERSVVSWTSMIAGYAREGLSDEAIKLFRRMEEDGIRPDVVTLTTMVHACACSGSLEDGEYIHNYIKESDFQSSMFVSNALMDMYAKCGNMEGAKSVFLQMPMKDIVSWNTMIGGYSKNCLPNEALNLFITMLQESRPDSRTMSCMLPACASIAALDRGREIHCYILRNGLYSDQHVANALVDMYVKCGALVLARSLFDAIPTKDLILWTVMIAGYGMHGWGKEAVSAFHDMRSAGIVPDEVSFISILYACSHSGLLDEGWRFFNLMTNEFKIKPMLDHYACMVDLLARTGKLSKAYKFIETMPIEPDATIWGALLCGCRIHHDIELAEKVAERVFELEPENTGYYVLLANIYAEADKWEEVKKLRQKIGRRALKKNPGCSWIEIKGKVNIFFAGGTSHPQARRIESLLKRLRMKMKEEGCLPELRYALIDADEMEKEVVLCGHSEKLAMAFGLLSLPPGKPIRVTKNLRVCGDCHEMARFISRTSRREIVLRDSNRFHHFKDGACSCRGFW